MINIESNGNVAIELPSFTFWNLEHITVIKFNDIYFRITRDNYGAAKDDEEDEYLWLSLSVSNLFTILLFFGYDFSFPFILFKRGEELS